MCIAIYVPANKTITEKQIRNCFSNNPDGAGVMHYDRNGQVHYTKGFMNVESLLMYWNHCTSSKYPRALHCRIATSGKISKGCCHPFPITNNLDDMLKPSGIGMNGCLIHNGVFSRYTPKEGMESLYSDTMYFTQKVIFPVADLLNNSGVEELLSDMTSRVLVFLPNYEVHRYGKWEYESENGFYASNSTYDYDKDYWDKWKKSSGKTCTQSSTPYVYSCYSGYYPLDYEEPVTSALPTEDKQMTDEYGITLKAHSYYEASKMLDGFLDRYWRSLTDGGCEAYESLDVFDDKGTWFFYISTHQDITASLKTEEEFEVLEHIKYDKDGNPTYIYEE